MLLEVLFWLKVVGNRWFMMFWLMVVVFCVNSVVELLVIYGEMSIFFIGVLLFFEIEVY